MNEMMIQNFTNTLFGSVRSTIIDNEPWFVASDIASCLGYTNTRKAIQDHVYEHYKRFLSSNDSLPLNLQFGGKNNYGAIIINEAGLYQLIFSSKLPAAQTFADWVYSEVLPTMRKIGFEKSMEILRAENDRLSIENESLSMSNADLHNDNQKLNETIGCLESQLEHYIDFDKEN